jgi:uracil-DNA glycosylase family 4
MTKLLAAVRESIITCNRCPRLRTYCQRIGREKRAAFRHDTYWAKPVPGFGDPKARIVLIGLAPAAHGANRTGRVFTGDGGGGSGDFLMEALHANGLANRTDSQSIDDGLTLPDTWIMAAVRCAPPDNKPTTREIAACAPHLRAELDALPNVRVYVALGRIAYDACWRLIAERHRDRLRASGDWPRARPAFEHGGVYRLPGAPTIVAAYHPSRQNTHTGRLTQSMMRAALRQARRESRRESPPG